MEIAVNCIISRCKTNEKGNSTVYAYDLDAGRELQFILLGSAVPEAAIDKLPHRIILSGVYFSRTKDSMLVMVEALHDGASSKGKA